jgi:hypothetical protein
MNVTINILELASELASYELEETWGDTIKIYNEDENGDTYYTEQAQEIFNDLYDKFYSIIENYTIKP